ncbi:hypothetical protein QCA50_015349 [Cerrena zonata]|uniref:Fe2OG dioxygenase domain-containing protein n=1 Tax=Cerrena zonata TaxID=2478898 RepID=A0AAW0FW86_9APHY
MSGSNTLPINPIKSEQANFNHIKDILTSGKPYCSGTLTVKKDQLILFYGKDDNIGGRIDFSNTSPEQLGRLAEACKPMNFDVNQESVLKSKELDALQFCPLLDVDSLARLLHQELLPDIKHDTSIYLVKHKLDVYEPGSSIKPDVDTPRDANMFASLVIVFPTTHEGGTFVLREADTEWTVDSAHDISLNPDSCIAFIAFRSDIEHKVLPVTSGYRVTMTYNLYYNKPSPTLTYIPSNVDARYPRLKVAFEEMLGQPDFLPNGGYLGFGLQAQYGINEETDLKDVLKNLKGSDALLMTVCQDIPVNVSLRMLYKEDGGVGHTILTHEVYDPQGAFFDSEDDALNEIASYSEGALRATDSVSPVKTDQGHTADIVIKCIIQDGNGYVFRRILMYGHKPGIVDYIGHACLIVAIGPYGDRTDTEKIDSFKEFNEEDYRAGRPE